MSDAPVPAPKPFFVPKREEVTRESDPSGRWSAQFPEMIGFHNQGGGKVPADFGWRTNPKQWQEELTEESLATRRALPHVPQPPQLPEPKKD